MPLQPSHRTSWFRRQAPARALALFGTPLPPPLPDVVQRLAAAGPGTTVRERDAPGSARWMVEVVHPAWGAATVTSPLEPMLIEPELVGLEPTLLPDEAEAVRASRSSLMVDAVGPREDVLHDRKCLLRFARAVLAADGAAAWDVVSQRGWSRSSLDDELAHDARLDIESLFVLHAVGRVPDGVTWLHSHGLAEIGFFDFDVLRPHPDVIGRAPEILRSLAFQILEGEATPGARALLASPGGEVLLLPVDEFARSADPEHVALRDDDASGHSGPRVVACDPSAGGWPWRRRHRPSRFLQREVPAGIVVPFSDATSTLLAERALQTYPTLRSAAAELEGLELPAVVKLRFVTDDGRSHENLWFEVEALGDDGITCTLANEPHAVSSLARGQRGTHPVERLADWAVFTPFGPVNPRALVALRMVRANRGEMERLLREHREGGP